MTERDCRWLEAVPMGRQMKCICELIRGRDAWAFWYPYTGKARYAVKGKDEKEMRYHL